jgi:hypothetical protein
MPTTPKLLLAGVIVELTLATALIHLMLGGTLFMLNAAGYLALGSAYLVAVTVPVPVIRRLGWLPRVGLAAYASATIVAYLATGPYFMLGWATKGIELALVMLIVVDLLIVAEGSRVSRRPPTVS